jgi:hypothetical protein
MLKNLIKPFTKIRFVIASEAKQSSKKRAETVRKCNSVKTGAKSLFKKVYERVLICFRVMRKRNI